MGFNTNLFIDLSPLGLGLTLVQENPENLLISLTAFGGILVWTVTQNNHKMSPVQRYLENQRFPLAAFGGILVWTVTQNNQQILLVQENLENLLISLAAFGGILA